MKLIEVIMVVALLSLVLCALVIFLADIADTAVRTQNLRQKIYGMRQKLLEADEQADMSSTASEGGWQ